MAQFESTAAAATGVRIPTRLRTPVGVSLFGKALEIATLVAITVLIPRALGPDNYGRFAVALSATMIVSSSLSLGGPMLLSRFVPAAEPAERLPLARALTHRLARLRVAQLVGIAAVAGVLATVAPDRFATPLTALVLVAVAFEVGAAFSFQLLLGLGSTTLWSFRFPLQNVVLCTAALVLYAVAGITGAIVAIVLASAGSFMLGGFLAGRRLRGVRPLETIPPGAMRFGVIQTVGGGFAQVPARGAAVAVVVLIGSHRQAGFAALAAGAAMAVSYAVWQAFSVELPRLAARFVSEPNEVEAQARRLATVAVAALVPLGLVLVVVVGWALPRVVDPAFADAAPAFIPALAVLPLAPLSALASQIAALRLQPGVRALGNAVGAVAFVVVSVVAVPSWGAAGVTTALLASFAASIVVSVVRLPGTFNAALLVGGFAGAAAILTAGVVLG